MGLRGSQDLWPPSPIMAPGTGELNSGGNPCHGLASYPRRSRNPSSQVDILLVTTVTGLIAGLIGNVVIIA